MSIDLFGEEEFAAKRNMRDMFIVPPFSILDTTEQRWKIRRRRWLAITGDLSETRDGSTGFGTIGQAGVSADTKGMMTKINKGTSNFDPVLAEIICKWFNIPGGWWLDPFGGEQTKGVVAGELGYPYEAVEFREDQTLLNQSKTKQYKNVLYHHGDSNIISEIITRRGFDFVFTSPPYYDLELYSKEDMSALGTYEEFMAQYYNIFRQCYNMLADNRFLVVKITEIRDKKTGEYRNFVGDNITIMKQIGFKYYNEIIIQNSVGSLPLRSAKAMDAGRKIGKMHQNVLVFYKGDMKKVNETFPDLAGENKHYAK